MTAMCKQPGLNMQEVDRSCILGSLFVRKTGSKPDGCQMWLLGYPARIRVKVCGLAVGGLILQRRSKGRSVDSVFITCWSSHQTITWTCMGPCPRRLLRLTVGEVHGGMAECCELALICTRLARLRRTSYEKSGYYFRRWVSGDEKVPRRSSRTLAEDTSGTVVLQCDWA